MDASKWKANHHTPPPNILMHELIIFRTTTTKDFYDYAATTSADVTTCESACYENGDAILNSSADNNIVVFPQVNTAFIAQYLAYIIDNNLHGLVLKIDCKNKSTLINCASFVVVEIVQCK